MAAAGDPGRRGANAGPPPPADQGPAADPGPDTGWRCPGGGPRAWGRPRHVQKEHGAGRPLPAPPAPTGAAPSLNCRAAICYGQRGSPGSSASTRAMALDRLILPEAAGRRPKVWIAWRGLLGIGRLACKRAAAPHGGGGSAAAWALGQLECPDSNLLQPDLSEPADVGDHAQECPQPFAGGAGATASTDAADPPLLLDAARASLQLLIFQPLVHQCITLDANCTLGKVVEQLGLGVVLAPGVEGRHSSAAMRVSHTLEETELV